jgi:hypothetical protein
MIVSQIAGWVFSIQVRRDEKCEREEEQMDE